MWQWLWKRRLRSMASESTHDPGPPFMLEGNRYMCWVFAPDGRTHCTLPLGHADSHMVLLADRQPLLVWANEAGQMQKRSTWVVHTVVRGGRQVHKIEGYVTEDEAKVEAVNLAMRAVRERLIEVTSIEELPMLKEDIGGPSAQS